MTVLKCYATTCVYNKEQLCSKGNIDVMGENAHLSEDTCCGSFRERSNSSPQNNYTSVVDAKLFRLTARHITVPTMTIASVQRLPFR